jgi:hypothetical protein
MRQDEHGWDPKGAPVLIDLEGAVDDGGKLSAWRGTFFYPKQTATNVALLGSELAGLPSDAGMNPGGVLNDTAIPYHCANVRTVVRRLATTALRPSWIRSPGRMQNTFANEAFLDELATLAGKDPLDLRLESIDDDHRGAAVLERVATLSGWRTRPRPDPRAEVAVGLGLAWRKPKSRGPQARCVCAESSSRMIAGRSSIRTARATRSRATLSRR